MRPRNHAWKRMPIAAVVLIALLAAACGKEAGPTTSPGSSAASGGSAASLVGAGATFPAPLYLEWITKYKGVKSNVSINYQGIGSGGGITQFTNQATDFGASDAFMSDAEIATATSKRKCAPLHIPTVFGAVTVPFNLPGVKDLTLDGTTLANIFLGKITKWNDTAIKTLNTGASLPSTAIKVVHRADDSGTSKIFTTYLSDVSPTWKSQVGAHKGTGDGLKWPTGAGAQGNDGVAAAVQGANNAGAIGYVELSYALDSKLATAKLKNKDGNAITPSIESTQAAVQSLTIPDDLRFSVLGVGGQGYPIVGATWILAWECGYPAAKAAALKDFLRWALNSGSQTALDLHYAPVFPALKTKSLANVEKINSKG